MLMPTSTSAPDYGPVPVSRLKAETSHIFTALQNGRRVLISRRGDVVAAIEPAGNGRYIQELAAFALPGAAPYAELTASDISQGSPSETVHAAEAGAPAFVTRNNKVYGVLAALPAPPTAESAPYEAWLAARERALHEFSRHNPQATPNEFAEAVAAYPEFSETDGSRHLITRENRDSPAEDDVDAGFVEVDGQPVFVYRTQIHAVLLRAMADAQREIDELLLGAGAGGHPSADPHPNG